MNENKITDFAAENKQRLKALRSPCPVSAVLDILGDKWTLIIVRDLLLGKKTYGELQNSPEGIPSNILADRLKKLQLVGIVAKQLYQEKPKRYQYKLTEKGQELLPMIIELVRWGLKHVPGTDVSEDVKAYL